MAEELVGIINAARAQFLECRDLQFVTKDEVEQWVGAMHTQALLPITETETAGDVLNRILAQDSKAPEKVLLLSVHPSHVHIEDTEGAVIVHLYNYFLSLRSVGAIIDADFVVQGSMLQSSFGPSLCVVEKETLDEDTGTRVYEELARIEPWHILMQESLSGLYDFTVPISLGESLDNSQFRVTIYVQEDFNSIPYSMEDTSAFDTYAATHIPALQVTVDGSSTTLSQKEPETDEPLGEGFDWAPAEVEADAELPLEPADMKPYSVAISVQLAITDDEYDRLRLDGFVLLSASNPDKLSFAASEQTSEPPVWATEVKIMVKWGAYDDEDMGIEDLRWFTCTTESTGQLVELLDDAETPLDVTAYEILRTYDFSVTPDRHVYLAVKYGESPRCVGMNLSPVAALLGEEAEVDEETMHPYTESHFVTLTTFDRSAIEVDCTGVFRIVPNDTIFRERHLLLLDFSVELDEDYRYRLADAKLTEEPSASIVKSEEYADFMDAEEGKLRMRSGANLEEDDGSVFSDVRGVELDEEPVLTMEDLQMHMEALQEEQDALLRAHVDVQRLCVALLQREKQNQQQTVAASATNPDDKHAAAGDKESAALAEGESAVENDAEKKRHFEENLELIYASRTRLQRQRHETEQISIDLQTRLDDMTAKVNDVCATFVAFKREIMSKSLDSRTGKSIASIRIDAIEASLKEEVLQEVRLRNIGLRMALNKLEKARKNREQLAEGLHMIDFEQLKIENQTLNEKIEERNEELSKLKRKKVTMVQVLTHAREKLRFVEKQNEDTQKELERVERLIGKERSLMNTLKMERDSTREEATELVRRQGFGTSDMLLQDFERRKVAIAGIRFEITEFEARYKALSKQIEKNTLQIEEHRSVESQQSLSLKLPPISKNC